MKKYRFDEYINGPDHPDYYDQIGHKSMNVIIGVVFLIVVFKSIDMLVF